MKRHVLCAILVVCTTATAPAEDLTPAQRADFEKTIQIYTTSVLPSNPRDPRAYKIRGFAFYSLGQYDRALEDYSQAIHFSPGFNDYYRDRAYTYEALGQYDKAVEDFSAAIRLSPQRSATYVDRGEALWQLKQYAPASADYQRAIQLDPRNAAACHGLAWILLNSPDEKLRNAAQAAQWAQRACNLAPDNARYRGTLDAAQAAIKEHSGKSN